MLSACVSTVTSSASKLPLSNTHTPSRTNTHHLSLKHTYPLSHTHTLSLARAHTFPRHGECKCKTCCRAQRAEGPHQLSGTPGRDTSPCTQKASTEKSQEKSLYPQYGWSAHYNNIEISGSTSRACSASKPASIVRCWMSPSGIFEVSTPCNRSVTSN